MRLETRDFVCLEQGFQGGLSIVRGDHQFLSGFVMNSLHPYPSVLLDLCMCTLSGSDP